MSTPFDVGPLTWVKAEIDQSLTKAAEALTTFTASVTSGNADATRLKFCKTHLHQAHGALQIVGLDGVTKLSEEIEALVARFDTHADAITVVNTQAAVDGMAAISRYLDELAQGGAHQPTKLFAAYQAVMHARGATRFAESDLFFPDLSHRPPQRTDTVRPENMGEYMRQARSSFERGLLQYLRNASDSAGLKNMLGAVQKIEATQSMPQHRAFWWVTIGFIETLLESDAASTLDAKRLLARIDLQMKRLMEGSANVAEKLMRDALFFVAKSRGEGEQVQAVKAAYGLADALPTAKAEGVNIDPFIDTLRHIREALAQAKDKWNKFSAGTKAELPAFIGVIKDVAGQVGLLKQPDYLRLTQAIGTVANWVAAPVGEGGGGKATDAVALEMATSLILCENAAQTYARIAADPSEFSMQVSAMTARLKAAITGKTEDVPPVPALDEMSRRAEERLLMAQVAAEIQTNLRGIEQVLDNFFREPEVPHDLNGLQGQLRQVAGALMILQQDEAVKAVSGLQTQIQQFSAKGYQTRSSDFEQVAQTLSGLGFFVDALQHGPADFSRFMEPLKVRPAAVPQAAPAPVSASLAVSVAAALDLDAPLLIPTDPDPHPTPHALAALGEIQIESIDFPVIASAEDDFIKKSLDEAAALAGLFPSEPAPASSTPQALVAPPEVSTGEGIDLDLDGDWGDGEGETAAELAPMTVEHELEVEKREAQVLFEAFAATPQDPALKADLRARLKVIEDDAELVDDNTVRMQAIDAMQLLKTGNLSVEVAKLRAAMPSIVLDLDRIDEHAPSAAVQALADAPDEALDAEFLQIFLEEAQEVLSTIAVHIPQLREELGNREYFNTIQRGFHTLKGSGRMVGLAHFGDVAESIEKTLKKWLEEGKSATPTLMDLSEGAGELFIGWVEYLTNNGKSAIRGDAMIAAALRVREGGAFELRNEVIATAASEAAEIDTITFAHMVVPSEIAEIDLSLQALLPIKVESPTTEPNMLVRTDGAASPTNPFALRDSPPTQVMSAQPVPPITAPLIAPVIAPLSAANAVAAAISTPAAVIAGGAAAALMAKSAQILQAAREARTRTGPTPTEEAVTLDLPKVEGTRPPKGPDSTVNIGEARVSPALYNIFVQEADSHLLTLRKELVRLENEPNEIVSEGFVRATHTLAGIAGTVHFAKLSDLARELELSVLPARKQSISFYQPERKLLGDCVAALGEMLDAVKNLRQPASAEGLIAQLYNLKADLQDRAPSAAGENKPDWMRITQSMAILKTQHLRSTTQNQAALQQTTEEPMLAMEELMPALVIAPPTITSRAIDAPRSPPPFSAVTQADTVTLAGAGYGSAQANTTVTVSTTATGESPVVGMQVTPMPDGLVDDTVTISAEVPYVPEATIVVPVVVVASTVPATPIGPGFAEEDAPTGMELLRAAAAATPEMPVPRAATFAAFDAQTQELEDASDRRTERLDDDIDEQLLPIFMEEALELIPQVGHDLRAWQTDSHDPAPAQSLLRSLHTLKGSARMAGAMAIGQLTHSMESRIENALELPQIPLAFFEELTTSYDRANFLMDKLARYNPETARIERAAREARAVVEEAQDMLQMSPSMVRRLGMTQGLKALTDTQKVQAFMATTQAEPYAAMGNTQRLAALASFDAPVVRTLPPSAPADAAITAAATTTFTAPQASAISAAFTPAGTGQKSVAIAMPTQTAQQTLDAGKALLRVRADMVDRLVNQAGEVSIGRSRIEGEMRSLKGSLKELTENVIRLRTQLREMEIAAESQMQSRMDLQKERNMDFDPLEFDRFTRFQELTRLMAESVNDVATVQASLLKNLDDADAALVAQARTNRELQNDIMRVRMVPFGTVSERLYRVVRQTAKELNKRANLDIRGTQAEIDRSVLERMTGPIEHLLRNAIAHGIEGRETRLQSGKTELGEIALTVRQEGNEFVLVFADDGAGINVERVRAKAIAKGLMSPADQLSDSQVAEFIFAAGFSTADTVSEISGRGVGMDVVRAEVSALGGRIDIDFKTGRGTTFTIYLPLTLAVTQVVLVRAGSATYAFPAAMVEQVRQVKPPDLARSYEQHSYEWQGRDYPLYFLPRLLGETTVATQGQRYTPILLLRSGAQRVAVHVDEMAGNQEVVVKNIGPQLARVTGVSGATVLGSGQIVLILNPVQLMQAHSAGEAVRRAQPAVPGSAASMVADHAAHGQAAQVSAPVVPGAAVAPIRRLPTVMVVDDSLTVRKITSRFLTREGFQVLAAKDGVDALEQLGDLMPDLMLVDVEMPRMDGFDLTRNVRADERLRHIPIIMITSRTADKHRNYAKQIGVNVFLGKPYQEDELLVHINQFAQGTAQRAAA